MIHFRAIVFAGLVSCTGYEAGGQWKSSSTPIVGGTPSDVGEFPSVGALVMVDATGDAQRAALVCSATLIAPDAFVTAAHCPWLLEGLDERDEIRLYFSLDLDTRELSPSQLPESSFEVVRIVAHPGFKKDSIAQGLDDARDIAVGLLKTHVHTVMPSALAEEYVSVEVGDPVAIVGYGWTDTAQDKSLVGVKHQAFSVIDAVGTSEMQVGTNLPGPQKCRGDSGGPSILAFTDGKLPSERLVGVTSRAFDSEECATGSIDTRVDVHVAWIKETLRSFCEAEERTQCEEDLGLTVPKPGPVTEPPLEQDDSGCTCTTAVAPSRLPWTILLLSVAIVSRCYRQRARRFVCKLVGS